MRLQIAIDNEKYLQKKKRIQKTKEAKNKTDSVNVINISNNLTRTRALDDVLNEGLKWI